MSNKGRLIVLSAPAGTGKTTLAHMLMNKHPSKIVQSISCTTRQPRSGEVQAHHYHFITKEAFEEKIKTNQFIEYAKVFDHYYGTLKEEINQILNQGKHALLVIDIQGAMQIKNKRDALLIFIAPPSIEELKKRLEFRNSENEQSMQKRLSEADKELQMAKEYDYVIINSDLQKAYEELESIIFKETGDQEYDGSR